MITEQMPQEKLYERVIDIYDNLTMETYYGFNFRMMLCGASEDFLAKLEAFLIGCKEGRNAMPSKGNKK